MACQEESHTRLNGGAHAVAGGFSAHLRAKSALRRWLGQSQRAVACAGVVCIQRRFNKTCSLASGMYFVSRDKGGVVVLGRFNASLISFLLLVASGLFCFAVSLLLFLLLDLSVLQASVFGAALAGFLLLALVTT